MLIHLGGVWGTSIVKRRMALYLQLEPPPDHPHPADELSVLPRPSADRHIVLDLGDPIGVQEAGDQDVGFWPVILFSAQRAGRDWGNSEAPTLLRVKDRSEDAGRVETR